MREGRRRRPGEAHRALVLLLLPALLVGCTYRAYSGPRLGRDETARIEGRFVRIEQVSFEHVVERADVLPGAVSVTLLMDQQVFPNPSAAGVRLLGFCGVMFLAQPGHRYAMDVTVSPDFSWQGWMTDAETGERFECECYRRPPDPWPSERCAERFGLDAAAEWRHWGRISAPTYRQFPPLPPTDRTRHPVEVGR